MNMALVAKAGKLAVRQCRRDIRNPKKRPRVLWLLGAGTAAAGAVLAVKLPQWKRQAELGRMVRHAEAGRQQQLEDALLGAGRDDA